MKIGASFSIYPKIEGKNIEMGLYSIKVYNSAGEFLFSTVLNDKELEKWTSKKH